MKVLMRPDRSAEPTKTDTGKVCLHARSRQGPNEVAAGGRERGPRFDTEDSAN